MAGRARRDTAVVVLKHVELACADIAHARRRKLLAKVCLVREEIQNVARERSLGSGGTAAALGTADAARQGVPRKSVAFLKARWL